MTKFCRRQLERQNTDVKFQVVSGGLCSFGVGLLVGSEVLGAGSLVLFFGSLFFVSVLET